MTLSLTFGFTARGLPLAISMNETDTALHSSVEEFLSLSLSGCIIFPENKRKKLLLQIFKKNQESLYYIRPTDFRFLVVVSI